MSFLRKVREKQINKQFRILLSPIYNQFYRYIYSIVRNNALTEDIVQEALYIALKQFSNLRDKNKFKSWLFIIGKNESIKCLKRYHREIQLEDKTLDFVAVSLEEPIDKLINKETKKEIVKIINSLKDEYKDVILLKYYSGLSLKEISNVLNENYNTIRSRHIRAKSLLEQKLCSNLNRNRKDVKSDKR